MAASSRSAGTPGDEAAQHPDRERHDRGDVEDGSAPMTLLSRPSELIILYCAMNRPSAGSIWISRSASTNDSRPRNRKRLIASGAEEGEDDGSRRPR